MKPMQYPTILVERPHQFPGTAYVVRDLAELCEAGYNDRNPWHMTTCTTAVELADVFGADVPAGCPTGVFPITEICRGNDAEWTTTPPTDEEFALESIAHDLHALDVIDSKEKYESYCRTAHNVPIAKLDRAARELGWLVDLPTCDFCDEAATAKSADGDDVCVQCATAAALS